MRPAFSVILLTTLIGAAQGLFVALYCAELAAAAGLAPAPGAKLLSIGSGVAVLLGTGGLAASFFHLGRPARAWRAAAMWRTSWLSREVIVLPAFLAGTAAYGAAHHAGMPGTLALGAAVLALCLALFACTAMIYMCLRFLQEWASPLTLLNFLLMGLASGFMVATPLASAWAPGWAGTYAMAAIALTLCALAARLASLARNARLRPRSTIQSATGLSGHVVQASRGFTARSYNTMEFFHGASRGRMQAVKWAFLLAGFVVPAALGAAAYHWSSAALFSAAALLQYAGLVAERWFFFAQANHPQNLYYQATI